ncbi:bile acid:sodium symporter [Aureococcus anophagefferens]|nr:bile acid:sodium symporter [Aureococcus anophagefferens]
MRSAALVVALSAGSHAFVTPSVRLGAPSLQRVAAARPTMLATPCAAPSGPALAASIPAEADAPKATLFETYTKYFTAGLAVLMLSMGITLSPKDFARVATRPNAVLLNRALLRHDARAGLGLGKLWGLDPAMVAGMVLVGSINGGQASNLCTFIAKNACPSCSSTSSASSATGSRLLGFGEATSRTMAIETSMKSSAFGFLLAKLHFGDFACRVPSACPSSGWLHGSSMAVVALHEGQPQSSTATSASASRVDVISIVKRTLGKK